MPLFMYWSLFPKAQAAQKSYKLAPHWDQRIVFSFCTYQLGGPREQMKLSCLSPAQIFLWGKNKWGLCTGTQRNTRRKKALLYAAVEQENPRFFSYFHIPSSLWIIYWKINSRTIFIFSHHQSFEIKLNRGKMIFWISRSILRTTSSSRKHKKIIFWIS